MLAITYFIDTDALLGAVICAFWFLAQCLLVGAAIVTAPIIWATVVSVVSYLALPAVLLAAFAYVTYPR